MKSVDLRIKIGKTVFNNPVWVASGTYGTGEEFTPFYDVNEVGAIVAKTITLEPRIGNPSPRVVETASGLLNSIGLENKGVRRFVEEETPFLKNLSTKVIISVAGGEETEFVECVKALTAKYSPDGIELNFSCPNVKHKEGEFRLIAQDQAVTEKITRAVRCVFTGTLIVKLTPNVTDIASIALAAERGGADAVSLVNTYFGMAVDAEKMRPVLGNVTGGLSGPAIKPLALKAVKDVYGSVNVPVIGMGGIMSGLDVAEFVLAGASAVQVGTANLVDPQRYTGILKEFTQYLARKAAQKHSDLIGKLWGRKQSA